MSALLKTLQQRLTALDHVSVQAIDLIELSSSNQPFLQFTPTPTFAAGWPEGMQLDCDDATLQAFLGAVDAARKLDNRLQKRCDKLVPKKMVPPHPLSLPPLTSPCLPPPIILPWSARARLGR